MPATQLTGQTAKQFKVDLSRRTAEPPRAREDKLKNHTRRYSPKGLRQDPSQQDTWPAGTFDTQSNDLQVNTNSSDSTSNTTPATIEELTTHDDVASSISILHLDRRLVAANEPASISTSNGIHFQA
jgi:hypothetical protein